METKKTWHSCRLAPHRESGKIRWRVGQERAWEWKLKILVFVPLVLLLITALAMLLTYIYQAKEPEEKHTTSESPVVTFDENERFIEEKSILKFAQTSFVPTKKYVFDTENEPNIRRKRDIEIKLTNVTNDETYQDFPYHPEEPLKLPHPCYKKKPKTMKENNKAFDYNFWKDHGTLEVVRKTQAETMINYMNSKVDPCYDFYKYACGNWDVYNPIPPDKAEFDTFEILRENLDSVLRDLLIEENVSEDTDSYGKVNSPNVINESNEEIYQVDSDDPIEKAKNLYQSCINEDVINHRREKPLLELLGKLKGWPVLENTWSEEEFDLLWLLGQLRLYNNDILISEWVGPDIKKSGEYLIQLDQTTLGLPTREYFLLDTNVKYLEAYRIYMITIANLLGAQINNATRDADRMIDFETSLAKITASQDKRRNVSEMYTRMTIGELQTIIPQIDWIRYLKMVVNIDIDPSQVVVCYCLDYLQDLMILIAQTPPRTVANYILWRFVRHRVTNLDERFHEAKQRFYYVIFGREETPPRWQTCVTQVNSHMGMTVGSLFVQKYFDETSKNETLEMTKEIRESFREILAESFWLDEDTRKTAVLKLDAMKLRIGYPDFILHRETLRSRYMDVKIRRNYYFENILSVLRHLTTMEHERLGKKVDKTVWNTPPAVVNAYYSRNKNQIMFPAGILQPPFYQKSFPRSLNYGGIGVVIGHEITHGFDDKGRLFNEEGNLDRWWKESSIAEFHDRAQCLVDQYNTYVVPEVHIQVDGVTTQGENIADNGGIKQAFTAYKKWLKQNPDEDEGLPGLNLTNEQLFFLNFAQVWCGKSRPEATKNRIKTAVHAPGQFRVIGTLSNFESFAEAFNCPMGSPMNPKEKCSIW